MPEGDQDEGAVTVSVAPDLAGSVHQTLYLVLRKVLS
jgi:hypothetical protein